MRFHQFLTFLISILQLSLATAQKPSFTMTQIGPNNLLTTPWDIQFGPDGYLWITEREEGVILRVHTESGVRDELIKISGMSSTASQDGLLGMALDDGFGVERPFLYCSYTYLVSGERRQRLVRYTYSINDEDGSLSDPVTLIENLPSSNDHNSGRMVFGPDGKLYYTIGDQGGNQNRNYCNPILSQVLPTQEEVDAKDWTNYPGKILRLNKDGSIPDDNPLIEGVQSHIYSYGHRNPQGIVFSSSGFLYSDEHGPNTDDEVNKIDAGQNYGWPNVVGFQDDQAYDYCNWSTLPNCAAVDYRNGECPTPAVLLEESTFQAANYQDPLFSLFAVTDDYDYDNPACESAWICRPNVAPSSIEIYESDAIPSLKNSLLVTSLKRGRVYQLRLDESGTEVVGDTAQLFYTRNRYRDIAVSPDGKSVFIITDQGGRTSDLSGLNDERDLQNPGAILKFTLQESTPIEELIAVSPIRVWPNPVSDVMHIEVDRSIVSTVDVDLLNAAGQVVKRRVQIGHGVAKIAVDLPAGIYFLLLSTQAKSWQQKLILK